MPVFNYDVSIVADRQERPRKSQAMRRKFKNLVAQNNLSHGICCTLADDRSYQIREESPYRGTFVIGFHSAQVAEDAPREVHRK